MSQTVVLIHGAWLTPLSFEFFRRRYEAAGHTVVVPPWPFHDRPVEELRSSPHPDLGRLTIGAIADHFDAIIRALPRPPILIGHSLGGLVVQKLLDRGLGAAGVAISPAPARGIVPTPTALRAALPNLLTWRGWSRVVYMSRDRFAWGFANTSSGIQQARIYERLVVPTSGRLYYQLAFGIGSGVAFKNPDRAPLLLIAGEKDRSVEPSMVRANHARYRRSAAVTDYMSFPNRSHFLIGADGWEEIADYAMAWCEYFRAGDLTHPGIGAGAIAT